LSSITGKLFIGFSDVLGSSSVVTIFIAPYSLADQFIRARRSNSAGRKFHHAMLTTCE
jgi:hypothetical protein